MGANSLQLWIVTDGRAGNEKPCQALAAALVRHLAPTLIQTTEFRLTLRQPWDLVVPHFLQGGRRAIEGPLRDALNGPLPDLVISCGRRATLASVTIKRLSASRAFTCHLLNPRIDPALFDAVICPEHDQLQGSNVLTLLGSPNLIDNDWLQNQRLRYAAQFGPLAGPRLAVLIGASNRAYQIERAQLERLAMAASDWQQTNGGSVMVTTSRRTPPALVELTKQRFADASIVWTGDGDNPYPGMLAWADAFMVTPDSTNMCSEAAACGKPLMIDLPDADDSKFAHFHQTLRQRGHALPLAPPWQLEPMPPLRETDSIAVSLANKLATSGLLDATAAT